MTDIEAQQWEQLARQAVGACSNARITLQFLLAREPGIARYESVQGALDALDHVLGSHRP